MGDRLWTGKPLWRRTRHRCRNAELCTAVVRTVAARCWLLTVDDVETDNNITIYKAHNVRKKLNLRRRWTHSSSCASTTPTRSFSSCFSLSQPSVVRLAWVLGKSWVSKQAHRVIHQPVSVVLQCGAGAWLKGLDSGDQHWPTASGSALEVCYTLMCYTNRRLLTLLY